MIQSLRKRIDRMLASFMDNFGMNRTTALVSLMAAAALIVFAFFWFFHSAPPKKLTLTAGVPDSVYYKVALQYADALAKEGVKLTILTSSGALENLERLADPDDPADVGFVQAGLAKNIDTSRLISLGSVSYQPLLIFCHLPVKVTILSQLAGRRVAIGPEGSGTRALSLSLLALNGIDADGTTLFSPAEGEEAAKLLLEGKVDAAFLMADSASSATLRSLLRTNGISLVDIAQAEAYTRRAGYLHRLVLPKGARDFGKNIPGEDITLVSPTVELVAKDDLHPALSDLLLAAAADIHGRPALFQKRGEFPAPLEYEFKVSDDAKRYYKSGKGFLYRFLPFWLASLINRILVVFVPLIIVLIPGFKSLPALLRLRMKLRINKWYRRLLAVEHEAMLQIDDVARVELARRVDIIEEEVNKMKVPASYGDQFYFLRTHIHFVRGKLADGQMIEKQNKVKKHKAQDGGQKA